MAVVRDLACPLMVQLVPELTRASAHRGEVPALLHKELYPGAVSIPLPPSLPLALSIYPLAGMSAFL